MKGMRTIEVDGVLYSWKVGTSNVLIENRELKIKWLPFLEEFISDFRSYHWNHDSITPSLIQKYIQKQTKK